MSFQNSASAQHNADCRQQSLTSFGRLSAALSATNASTRRRRKQADRIEPHAAGQISGRPRFAPRYLVFFRKVSFTKASKRILESTFPRHRQPSQLTRPKIRGSCLKKRFPSARMPWVNPGPHGRNLRRRQAVSLSSASTIVRIQPGIVSTKITLRAFAGPPARPEVTALEEIRHVFRG